MTLSPQAPQLHAAVLGIVALQDNLFYNCRPISSAIFILKICKPVIPV